MTKLYKRVSIIVIALSIILSGCQQPLQTSTDISPKIEEEKIKTVVMIPKVIGSSYFDLCADGAEEAAEELGVKLIYKGPTTSDSASQVNIVQEMIAQKVDVIAIAPIEPAALMPVLEEAKNAGIKVITFDTDVDVASREVFVSQASYENLGKSLMDNVANGMDGEGEFAILTSSLTSDASNTLIQWIEIRMKEKYPNTRILFVVPVNDDQQEAFVQTQNLINAYPDLKGIIALSNIAITGAAKAVEASESTTVSLNGIGIPNDVRTHIENGTIDTATLWEPLNLGYLTMYVAKQTIEEQPFRDNRLYGKLGPLVYLDRESILIMDQPINFDSDNINDYNF